MDYQTNDLKLGISALPESSYEYFRRKITTSIAQKLAERIFGTPMSEKRKSYILREAERLTFGDRNDSYGHPLDDFSKTAKMITGVLLPKLKPGEEVTAEEFALIMVCCKISRLIQTPDHLDSMVDGPGYFNTYWMVREKRRADAGMDKLAPEINEPETGYVGMNTSGKAPELPTTTQEFAVNDIPVVEPSNPPVGTLLYIQKDGEFIPFGVVDKQGA